MNMIPVELKTEQPHVYTGVYQYDYGQILQIHGKNLPAAAEVQFSLQEHGGKAETRVGIMTNNVLEVRVPDKMLKNEGTTENYRIFAYLYITDGKSGNTEYKITIHVTSRPEPGEIGEDQEEKKILDEAVEMVNQAAGKAKEAEQNASSYAAKAEKSKEATEQAAQKSKEEANAVESMRKQIEETAKETIRCTNAAKEEAEAWAHGHTDHPECAEDNAKYYADAAKQVAAKNGFCRLDINEDGHLILKRTENIRDSLDFSINDKNGHLEVMME